MINPPETATKPERPLERYIAISSYSDFVLDFNVRSLIGSRTKLEDLPKLTDLITTKLRNVYIDKLVYPMFVKVKVPKMWEERDKKMQQQEEQEEQTSLEKKKEEKEPLIEESIVKEEDKLSSSSSSIGLKPKAKEKMEEFVEDIKEA